MAEEFDADQYRSGGWKTAIEKQFTHYKRLGLREDEHVSATTIVKAHKVRANWWRQRGAQAHGGKNNPLIAELAPFITTAEDNLQLALNVLSDVDRKSAYDKQLEGEEARAREEKLQEFIRFTLRDKLLTLSEKNDLLNQAQELGILRERAEELIAQEVEKAGATEGDEPAAGVPVQSNAATGTSLGTDSPRLVLGESSISLGVLPKGNRRELSISIDNRGGGVLAGAIYSSDPTWLRVSPPEIDTRRHHQEIAVCIETSALDLGKAYVGAIEVRSNGGRGVVRVDLSVELEATAVSRQRAHLFWLGVLCGAVFGYIIYPLLSPPSTAVIATQMFGCLGFIAFIVVCSKAGGWGGGIGGFFLVSFIDIVFRYASTRGYSAFVWAEIASAFLYFWARSLLVARLSGDLRPRVWAAASGVVLAAGIGVIGGAVAPSIQSALQPTPQPNTDNPARNINGSSEGAQRRPSDGATYEALAPVPPETANEINTAMSSWRDAMLSNDTGRLANCYSEKVDRYFLHTDVTQDYVRQYLSNLQGRGYSMERVDMSEIELRQISDSTVDAQFIEGFESSTASVEKIATVRTDLHFIKKDGMWKISYERQFTLPSDSAAQPPLNVPSVSPPAPRSSNGDSGKATVPSVQPTPQGVTREQWLALAESQFEHNDYQGAIRSCDEALRIDPGNSEAATLKAKVQKTLTILGK